MDQRVNYLDFLKGFGCFLMVVIHSSFKISTEPSVAYALIHIFASGTMYFLAATGITIVFQTRKYSLKYLTINGLLIAIFGLTYTTIVHPKLYDHFIFEILQLIGISSIITAWVHLTFKPNYWTYLLLGLAVYGLKLLSDWYLPNVGHGILLPDVRSNPDLLLQPGSFSLLPWLYQFFFGIFAFYATQRIIFIAAILNITATLFLWLQYPDIAQINNKWDMSIGYFFYSNALFFTTFWVVRLLKNIGGKYDFISYMGKRSLQVFMVQGFGLIVGSILLQISPYLTWISSITVTLFCLWALEKIPDALIFNKPAAWIVLGVIVIATPILPIIFDNKAAIVVSVLIALVCGIIFAKHYPQLNNLVKKATT